MLHSILLVEPDDEVARDIASSMKLLNVPVIRSPNSEAVASSLEVARPSLVLTRLSAANESELAENVRTAVAGGGGTVPIVLLLTRAEESLHARRLGEFPLRLMLPVQFPTFAQQVQELLTGVVVPPSPKPSAKAKASSKAKSLPEVEPAKPAPASDELKFLLACSLAHEVVQRVRRHPRLASVELHDVPGLVRELTNGVCGSYDVASFLREVHRGAGKT